MFTRQGYSARNADNGTDSLARVEHKSLKYKGLEFGGESRKVCRSHVGLCFANT